MLCEAYSFYFRSFQFLGIPPKGEPEPINKEVEQVYRSFPISRDPPEGGTQQTLRDLGVAFKVSNF